MTTQKIEVPQWLTPQGQDNYQRLASQMQTLTLSNRLLLSLLSDNLATYQEATKLMPSLTDDDATKLLATKRNTITSITQLLKDMSLEEKEVIDTMWDKNDTSKSVIHK